MTLHALRGRVEAENGSGRKHSRAQEIQRKSMRLTASPFYSDASLKGPYSMAIDGSGNVWVANYVGNSLTEFVGLAAPVVTPIASGVANNTLGTRP